jgi:DNA mismatch repair protein MutS2
MDAKTLTLLEYPKILDRLAGYAAFPVSAEKIRALRPTPDLVEAQARLDETSEAVNMLATRPDLTIGGVRDIRGPVDLANHGAVLTPAELNEIKFTLIAARSLARSFDRLGGQFPTLAALAARIAWPSGLVDAISRVLNERGDVLDSASAKLGTIRREMRIAYDRLMTRLQRIVSDQRNSPYLQEALITQRDGRYVIPLRAEFKGRIKAIVHDQSSSGATLFVEPLVAVELNNQYRELELAERDEVRRILADLSLQVGHNAAALLDTLEAVSDLDVAFAKAKYAEHLRAFAPRLHTLTGKQANDGSRHPGVIIRLFQARHPLLDQATVVPIDLELDERTYAVIITGPNTGGKTVSLKTAGLLALMAQSGLHIPAQSGSELSCFQAIYADIGDEQSIEQSLSTFSGHITNIIRILEQADRRSLVILDELGAGTDPQEGAQLARALLGHLLERGITTLVTTHHPELKAYAHGTPGVTNASVEFDLETLRPTFRLSLGLPGRSNALAIAERLGMPAVIVQAARAGLDPSDVRAEDLLDEIHRQRELSRQARAAADKARREAETLRAELARRLDRLEDERRSLLEAARSQAQADLETLQDELRQARKALARARQPLEVVQAVEEQAAALEERLEQPVARRPADAALEPPVQRPLRLGDKARVRSLNAVGVIIALGEEEAEVQVGMLRLRARYADLEQPSAAAEALPLAALRRQRKAAAPAASPPAPAQTGGLETHSPGIELDLRGQSAEDALEALDRHLDAAYLAGLPFVRIIHGKGTGKLRQAVRAALGQHPHVRSWESGSEKEGGDGVTVARL